MKPAIKYLSGKHVYLRPIEAEDMPTCQVWINDPEVRRFLSHVRPVDGVSEAGWHASHDRGLLPREVQFGIALHEGDRYIGNTSFMKIDWVSRAATSGTVIGEKDCWGKGYGTEAKALLIQYGFLTLNLNRLHSEVIAFNERSARHLLANGYTLEGRRRQACFRDGVYHDMLDFSLLREEWLARQS